MKSIPLPPKPDRLEETNYPAKRGLSFETLRRHGVTFDPNWRHPKAPATVPGTPRLLIPLQGGNYLARDTRDAVPPGQEEYVKSKVKVDETAGWTFNSEALTATKAGVIIAVEGEIDAMSIEEVGGTAVGIGSIAYGNGFLEQLKTTPPSVPIIVAFDNESDSEKAAMIYKAAAKLAEDIRSLGFDAVAIDPKLLTGEHKDANDALVADREGLRLAVKKLTEQYRRQPTKEEQEFINNSAMTELERLFHDLKNGVEPACLSTGFDEFDRQLDGGLYPGLYVLGAPSSLGKSSIAMQIADHVALLGTDVLIFSLEMTRRELIAKSLSRITSVQAMEQGLIPRETASTARDILMCGRAKSYSEPKKRLIWEAMKQYSKYADRVIISETNGGVSARTVSDTVARFIKATGRKPLVIVDYLQILAPLNDRMTDKQAADATIKELFNLRRTYDLPLIAISSYSRSSYDTPATMSAFKESGGIEYGADYLIGLQFEGVGSQNFDANNAKKNDPRKMELLILKQRLGPVCVPIKISYYAAFNLLIEN